MSLNTNGLPSTRAPYNSGTYNGGSSQGTERSKEALIIRRLEQEEKEMNTFIISAGGFSFSTTWLIVRNIQDLRARVAQITARHLTAHLSYAFSSPPVAIPPAPYTPDPVLSPSGSCLQRAIVYWLTGLVFCLTAMFIAIFVKQIIRSHRVVLQSHSQPWEKAKMQESFDGDAEALNVAMDTMYRLFQVSLVVLIIGHVNFFFFPVGPTIFVPAVIYGLVYVFDAIGPTVLSSQQPG